MRAARAVLLACSVMEASGHTVVIDPFRASDATLVEQMGRACRAGYGVVDMLELGGLLRGLSDQLQTFFTHPFSDDEKMKSPFGGCYGVGGEVTDGIADPRGGCYQFDLPHTGTNGSKLWNQTQPNFGKIPELQLNIQVYRRILGAVTQRMAQGLSMHLGLNSSFLQEKYLTPEPYSQILLSQYLSEQVPTPELELGEFGVGTHRDYGFFAFIFQPGVGGLQIQSPAGAWVDMPPMADRLAFVAGETLQILTGGYCKAAPHRVVRPKIEDRFSITAFISPSLKAVIRAGEACQTDSCTCAATPEECGLPEGLAEVAQKTPFFWEDYDIFTYERMFSDLIDSKSYHSVEFAPRSVDDGLLVLPACPRSSVPSSTSTSPTASPLS